MPLTLTAEQEAILATQPSAGMRIVINAYAGTGKTTTCRAIVERHGLNENFRGERVKNHPNGAGHRFLYLAFNKSIQQEAEAKFSELEFVDCRTSHSVALEFTRQRLPSLKIAAQLQTTHAQTRGILKGFFLGEDSQLPSQRTAEPNAPKRLKISSESELKTSYDADCIAEAHLIWKRMCAGTLPMTHDAYLKYFCLHPAASSWLSQRYDTLIIDEAQDISAVNVGFLLSLPQCLYFVGDQHQSIYAFRQTKNALARLPQLNLPKLAVHSLTHSFRFGADVADVANRLLHRFQLDKGQLVGAGHATAVQSFEQPLDDRVWAVVGRTNAAVFRYAVQRAADGKTLHFAFRDPNNVPVLQVIDDALNKYATRGDYLKLPMLNSDLESALEREDVEQARVLKLLKKNGAAQVRRMLAMVKQQMVPKQRANFVLGTVHSHKGLEWDHVLLLDDFVPLHRLEQQLNEFCLEHEIANRSSLADDDRVVHLIEEVHLYYVAATRAKQTLRPNASLAQFLAL